jgi:hypothetical protein
MAKWTGLGDNTKLFWAVLSHFEHQTMAFWRHDHQVKWKGVSSKPVMRLTLHDMENLMALLLEEFATLHQA